MTSLSEVTDSGSYFVMKNIFKQKTWQKKAGYKRVKKAEARHNCIALKTHFEAKMATQYASDRAQKPFKPPQLNLTPTRNDGDAFRKLSNVDKSSR